MEKPPSSCGNLFIYSDLRHEEISEPEVLTYSLQFSLVLVDLQCIKRNEEQTKHKSSHMPQEKKLCVLQVVQQLEKLTTINLTIKEIKNLTIKRK